MKKYPSNIFYKGNLELLNRKKISIVGSRSPNPYSREVTHLLANKLAQLGVCIVSGGALGIDTISHKAAGLENTIMVAGTGLDKRYPAINKKMIEQIEEKGLVLSQFEQGVPSRRYNFPLRNELVVSLSECLIVSYADLNSGTMRSVEYALKMKKQIFVLPHRINDSQGTNSLLKEGLAKAIYDIDEFISRFCKVETQVSQKDEFLEYCKTTPLYEEAIQKYASKVFEHELEGKIKVENGKVFLL